MAGFVITDGENYVPPAGFKTGLAPRNYSTHPLGYNAKVFDLKLFPEPDWAPRLKDQIEAGSHLEQVRDTGMFGEQIPSSDQDGQGYCWSYSTVGALTLTLAKQGEPYVELSPHAVACVIKNGRDQGGWGSESLEFIAENGVPSSKLWPLKSMDLRKYNTPEMRTDAKKHRITEWMDIPPLSKPHLVTCLLSNIPVVGDFNWWGHSVCIVRLLSLNPFVILIWNSWTNTWGVMGMGEIEGRKALPDGMICPRVAMAV